MTKIKNLLCILALCLVFPGVFLFSACGEEDNTNNQSGDDTSQNISYIEVSTQDQHFAGAQLEYTYGEQINLNDISFIVTAHRVNGETFVVSNNDVIIDASALENAKVNGVVPANSYTIEVSVQGFDQPQSVSVVVKPLELVIPNFDNADLTFTYNGAEQNIITSKLDALMPQGGESLSSMISTGKIEIVNHPESNVYAYAATDVLRDGANTIASYYLDIRPTSNYQIVNYAGAEGSVGNMIIFWSILPKVLNMPTFANNGEVVFDWEVVNNQTQMVPAQMSLVYGTDDDDVKVDMVSLVNANALTLNYFGSSTVDIELTSEYANNYALKEEAGSYYAQATVGEWRVVAYDMQPVAITGATKTTTYNDGTNDLTIPDFDYDPERTTITISMSAKEKQLFEIVDNGYNHYANGLDDAHSINFALKSNISGYSSPVTINGQPVNYFTLYYHISRIDTPTAVQAALGAINFELDAMTYIDDNPLTLSYSYGKNEFTTATQNALTSDLWREYEQYGYDYTYVEPVDQAQDISNANETGYTVPLRYYYGRQNYNPVVVNAKLIVNRNNIEIYNVEYHLSDNDNGRGPLIYRYNHPITMTISNINHGQVGNWGSTSYQYCATSAEGEFSPLVGSPLNAGYYKAQFELSTDANHKYSMQDIGAGWSITEKPSDSTKFVLTLAFKIDRRPIYLNPTITGDWGTYFIPYCYVGGNKTIDVNLSSASIYYFETSGQVSFTIAEAAGDELADILANINTPTIVTTNSGTPVQTMSAIGDYSTQFTFSFVNNSNYVFIGEWQENDTWETDPTHYNTFQSRVQETKTQTQEWSIISKTVDASGVAWDTTAIVYDRENNSQAPKLTNIPKGVNVDYSYRYVDSHSQICNSQSVPGYGNSNYKVRATLSLNTDVLGYDTNVNLTYPAGYDTTNDYLEQSYTYSPRQFTFAATDFGVLISTDSGYWNGVIAGRLGADGKLSVEIPYFFAEEMQNVRIILLNNNGVRSADANYFTDNFDYDNSTFPQAGDAVGTSGVVKGAVTTWEGAVLNDGVDIDFEVTWTIIQRTINPTYSDFAVYKVGVDGYPQFTIDDATVLGGIAVSENDQHIYIKSLYDAFLDYTYSNNQDDITVPGGSEVDTIGGPVTVTITIKETLEGKVVFENNEPIVISISWHNYN